MITYPLLIGTLDMSLATFYDGMYPSPQEEDYAVCPLLTRLIDKYPPTTEKLAVRRLDGKVFYEVLRVDVAVSARDLETYTHLQSVWAQVSNVQTIDSEEALVRSGVYKLKLLQSDGQFSERTLLCEALNANVKDIAEDFYIGKQFYALMAYSYACVFEAKSEERMYEAFQAYFGKYVYAITLEHAHGKIGLTWLDYIMHPPKGHLELGVTASKAGKRYEAFNCWEQGDRLTITVIADGFKDMVLTTTMEALGDATMLNSKYDEAMVKHYGTAQ